MRIDLLYVTEPVAKRVVWAEIDREARKGPPVPSDHGVHGKMAIHRVTANEAAATTFDARWDLAAERAPVPRRASRINRECAASRWNSAIRSLAVISAK